VLVLLQTSSELTRIHVLGLGNEFKHDNQKSLYAKQNQVHELIATAIKLLYSLFVWLVAGADLF
jgi:hypothetical protein